MGTENIIFFSIPTLHFDVHRFFILLITFILVFSLGFILLPNLFKGIFFLLLFSYISLNIFLNVSFLSLYIKFFLFYSAGFSECSFSVFFFISIIVLFLLILSRHIFKSYHLIFLFIYLPVLCLSCV